MKSLAIACSITLIAMALAHAQDAQRFEVASVRPNTSGADGVVFDTQFDRFMATNVRVDDIVRIAYGVRPFQLVNAPAWFESERYDIDAKAPGSPSRDDLRLMLRELLVERFALRARVEQRQLPVYEMRIASSDGRLGQQLRKVDLDCDPRAFDARRARRGSGPLPPGPRPECGLTREAGRLTAGGASMTQLADVLSGFLGRIVVDHTGLAGYFEFDVQYIPGQASSDDPSFFTALQEQLGLRLQGSRGAVDVLAIESAARPVAN
jgi:uncharacterized protein (TIGR03435 family)